VIHTAHGYWLAEAGPVDPAPSLAGDAGVDVVVIGGGYTGLWTAWQLRARGASVAVLEADLCGHGPSGRNGGFCETLWTHLPSLVERFGRERALALARASGESVRAIGAWCAEQGVDAWFEPSGYLMASTAPAHDAVIDDIVAVAPRHQVRARRCGRGATHRAFGAGWRCPTTRRYSPRGWRWGCGTGFATSCTSARGWWRCGSAPARSWPRPPAGGCAPAPRCWP
jgi:glycine/D-amino acid oxidase-like deaminating enzyme